MELFGKRLDIYQMTKFETCEKHQSIVGINLILPNSLPNDRISDWSKFKAFLEDKIKVL